MRMLILGGTGFVGRAIIHEAITRGWEVTALNRGHSTVPAGVDSRVGDRTAPGGLAAIAEGEWDLVVDTWSWAPSAVRDAAALLASRAGRYVYISSRSVYRWPAPAGAGESAPVVDGSPDDDHADEYARAKAGAEAAVIAAFGDRSLLIRPGLILGPYEDIGRLPWWLTRIAEGGRVLAPGPAELPVQYIDVRDLAQFTLSCAERDVSGPIDVVSRRGAISMADILQACVDVTGSDAHLIWTDPDRLLSVGVQPWSGLPIWLPPGDDHDAMHASDTSRAEAHGLVCRPVHETVADTWEWLQSIGGAAPQRADRPAPGISHELEESLLPDDFRGQSPELTV